MTDLLTDWITSRLAERAASEGLLDVAYASVDSPIGRLLVAQTPRGLVRVAFEREDDDDVLEEMARRLSPRVVEAPAQLDEVRRELDQYFDGRRQQFDLDVDLALVSGEFRRRCLERLYAVPFGEVRSYREVATAAGNAAAVRAAGTACATNPVPIVVPCHRVLRTDGTLGGYGGGVPRKEFLLRLEGSLLG
jgi:methylated-DNA-[protein]-cysteine S-methyltransferase